MKTKLFLIALLGVFVSCSASKERIYWVNSMKVHCPDEPQWCLQISKNKDISRPAWEVISFSIQNFVFEEGFFKKIRVKKVSSEKDASLFQYVMTKELEKQQDNTYFLTKSWTLQHIKGQAPKQEAVPTLEVLLQDKKIYGQGGCNNYFGTITELTERNIRFDYIGSTRKMCPEDQIEMLYFSALSEVRGYQIRNEQLVFLDDTGKEILTFRSEK